MHLYIYNYILIRKYKTVLGGQVEVLCVARPQYKDGGDIYLHGSFFPIMNIAMAGPK